MKKKIVGVTTARSEFGRLRNFYQSLSKNESYEFSLFIGFGHSDIQFGDSFSEIAEANIPIGFQMPFIEGGDDKKLAKLVVCFSDYLKKIKPDLVIIPGDRYEMLSVALVSTINQVPILHIGGGYVTLGAIDEQIRNAITKLSAIHFVASVECARRVENLNEDSNQIYITGAPELDEIVSYQPLVREKFLLKYNIKTSFILATFHPESSISIEQNIENSIIIEKFLNCLKYNILITAPCQDPGFEPLLNMCKKLSFNNPEKYIFIPTLGLDMYLSAMYHCDFMVGNSSSGIIESPTVGVPVLNIGNRQKFREHGTNVIHSEFNVESLLNAVSIIKNNFPDEKEKIQYDNPYGDGRFLEKADQIMKTLQFPISKINKF
jgi:UDP-hydrolysing UDP-N-acetyl-D-glucosamine 2-epimerase